ncbi:MAG: hypothetical protein ACLFOY_00540 [Desulfatibacillaceae bacterium]
MDRNLKPVEREVLYRYFGDSLDPAGINVDRLRLAPRPWSPLGGRIRLYPRHFKGGDPAKEIRVDDPPTCSVFLHEAVHVWQRQHGELVSFRGFLLQCVYAAGVDVYRYDTGLTDPGDMLRHFLLANLEQQGAMVQAMVYRDMTGMDGTVYGGIREYLKCR